MSSNVSLRAVADDDLPTFYAQQLDTDANRMAAFTAKDPSDREAFEAHWSRIRADETIVVRTIVVEAHVAGHIAKFDREGEPEVTYWIDKAWWGRGLATSALTCFLLEIIERPLFARVAADNHGSCRVLEKNGFRVADRERGFANARGEDVEELVYRLD